MTDGPPLSVPYPGLPSYGGAVSNRQPPQHNPWTIRCQEPPSLLTRATTASPQAICPFCEAPGPDNVGIEAQIKPPTQLLPNNPSSFISSPLQTLRQMSLTLGRAEVVATVDSSQQQQQQQQQQQLTSRKRREKKQERQRNRSGKWWRKFGYAGPAYCQRCSETFRDHIIRQISNSAHCKRSKPCYDCTKILRCFPSVRGGTNQRLHASLSLRFFRARACMLAPLAPG